MLSCLAWLPSLAARLQGPPFGYRPLRLSPVLCQTRPLIRPRHLLSAPPCGAFFPATLPRRPLAPRPLPSPAHCPSWAIKQIYPALPFPCTLDHAILYGTACRSSCQPPLSHTHLAQQGALDSCNSTQHSTPLAAQQWHSRTAAAPPSAIQHSSGTLALQQHPPSPFLMELSHGTACRSSCCLPPTLLRPQQHFRCRRCRAPVCARPHSLTSSAVALPPLFFSLCNYSSHLPACLPACLPAPSPSGAAKGLPPLRPTPCPATPALPRRPHPWAPHSADSVTAQPCRPVDQ